MLHINILLQQGEYEIVELLLEMPNIDVNLAMSDGQTALYFAIWVGYNHIKHI